MKGFVLLTFLASHIFAAKVGLCITATGKYIQFVDLLIASAEEYFCKNHDVTYFIFTDHDLQSTDRIKYLHHQRLGWPFDTMMRFQAYDMHRASLAGQNYLFAVDADMRFAGDVGDEILGERVATLHPGFFSTPRSGFSYEKNQLSTAYVRLGEGTSYFAGGFYGGTRDEFFKILEFCIKNIFIDLARGIIAVWHDESHWNRYCIDHPPTVVLSPSYCYAESWNISFPKKLIALNKCHKELRE